MAAVDVDYRATDETRFRSTDTEYERLPPLFELENYESCMERADAVYCIANLELYTDAPNDLYTLIQGYSKYTLKHYNYSRIDRAVCVTKTCEHFAVDTGIDINRDPRSVLEGCLNESIHNRYGLMAKIYNINCEKQLDADEIRIDYVDYIVLAIFLMLLVLTLVGSYCDIYSNGINTEQSYIKGKEFLLCFSIFQNLQRLTSAGPSDPRLNLLKGIHGVRTIANYLVVYSHVTTLISTTFMADPHTFEKAYESVLLRITFSATSIVQIFFTMSGLFMSYYLQIFSETYIMTWKTMPKIIFQRWWRLTPPAVMLVAFTATWMRHLSRGPLWNYYVTSGPSLQCRQFFWAHVFHTNNYVPEDTSCALHTWYIAADMQLFILGIIIHCVIRNRSTNFKLITLMSFVLVGMASPALHVWLQDLDAFSMRKPEVFRTFSDPTFRALHLFGHNNLTCFIIGMAAGYWIYYLHQKKVDYSNCKIGNFLCWCVIPFYILVIYCGSLFYHDGDRPSLALRMLYAATNKVFIGIINVVWAVGAAFKFNGLSKAVMEWSGWVIPSKLSYCVYLLHTILIFVLMGVRTQLAPVSFLNAFFVSIGILVVSYVIALPFHLLIEAPAARLVKVIANEKIKKKLE